MSMMRTRWAAIGAAIAVTLGAGGIGLVAATSPSDATAYQPITPCRVTDTRSDPDFNVGPKTSPLGPDETLTIDAHGSPGECTDIPDTASGLQLNVTALGATAPTFLTVWGDGDQPNASNLNPTPGAPATPNAVTTDLTSDGEFHVFNKFGFVDVIVDIAGIYTDHDHDDRYYTQAEVDSAIAAATAEPPWSVAIPFGDLVNFSAFGAVSQFFTGMGFAADSNGTVLVGFRLPASYRPGSDVLVDVLVGFPQFGGGTFPCATVWRFGSVIANRFRSDAIDVTASWVQPGADSDSIEIAWTQDDFDQRTIGGGTVTIDGTDLEPGDHITASLTRLGNDADDTCQLTAVPGLAARATR